MTDNKSSNQCLKHGQHGPGECPKCDELAEARSIVATTPIPPAPSSVTTAELIEWVQGLISTADMFSRRAEGDEWVEPVYFAALKERLEKSADETLAPLESAGSQLYRLLVIRGYAQHEAHMIAFAPKLALISSPEETSGLGLGADGYEEALRVEITSDAPEKIERFRKEVVNLILDAPSAGDHDVMVTIHRAGEIPVFETNRKPEKADGDDNIVKPYPGYMESP